MPTDESILDGFVEGLFRLMLEHHQRQVVVTELTLTQAQALRLLRSAGLPTSKLAAALGISAPAGTQLTDRLVRKQLIERRTAEGDRRWVSIELTEKGRQVVDGFRQRRNEVFAEVVSRLNDDERIQVIEVLGKLSAALDHPRQVFPEAKTGPTRQPTERRTPVQPAQASKKGDQSGVVDVPAGRPAKRMKIEWD